MMVKNERDILVKDNIAKIRKDLLSIDLALKSLDVEWSEDFSESRIKVGKLRKLFVEDIRLLDSVGSSIFYEEKVNSLNFGYRENTLGGNYRNSEVTKSDSDNLVSKILEGKIGARDIAKSLKPKNARNE